MKQQTTMRMKHKENIKMLDEAILFSYKQMSQLVINNTINI